MQSVEVKNQVIKENTKAVWGATPAGWVFGGGHQKGTKEFFDSVLEKRFTVECDWLDDVVNFKKYAGKKVLEVGCGAGYDAYQFCKHGALYTGIDITPDNPVITKQHLSFYGYSPTVLEADVEKISFQNEFDCVYSFGVLHHVPDIKKAFNNIHTALKPGGEAHIIVYNRHSIFYVLFIFFYWILGRRFLKMSLADMRSKIEYTAADAKALVNVYSKKEVHNLLRESGFVIEETAIRKLVREDLPAVPVVKRLYKYIPDAWLRFLGKRFGWYICVKAVKP